MEPGDVLPVLVARRGALGPADVFMVDAGGASVTAAELHTAAIAWAHHFRHRCGIRRGEKVLLSATPSIDAFAAWLGLAWSHAMPVFVNPALSGTPLERAVGAAGVALVVSDPGSSVEQVARRAGIRTAVLELSDAVATAEDPRGELESDPPMPDEVAAVLFTSGTSGFPKLVPVRWAQLHSAATGHIGLDFLVPTDCWYSPFPLSHVSGLFPAYAMALVGGRVVLRDRFRTGEFWTDLRDHACTVSLMFGATANFLLSAQPAVDDADNPMRAVVGFFPRAAEFRSRFGVPSHFRAYNQTEVSVPISTSGHGNPPDELTCGKLREGFEARLVDEHGNEVGVGEVGELVLRSHDPLALAEGYLDDPEASAQLWRGGWLHTGDLLRQNGEGWYYFVDRATDSVRRRGENISSVEVESEALAHPDVVEAAVVGVPAEDGESELLLVATAREGSDLTAADVTEFVSDRLPRFMVPRYVVIVEDMPRTDTGKIRKRDLRQLLDDESRTA
jgi:crotonobetaine/carnitine-CoA ligase